MVAKQRGVVVPGQRRDVEECLCVGGQQWQHRLEEDHQLAEQVDACGADRLDFRLLAFLFVQRPRCLVGDPGVGAVSQAHYFTHGACKVARLVGIGDARRSGQERVGQFRRGILGHQQAGDMTEKQRNQLLGSMTDEVGGLVLGNNYKQTQAISLAARKAYERIAEYKRLMNDLEARGKLDRAIEFLPSEEQLNERVAAGHGLTRAELSVLISYSKIDLKEALLNSRVPDDDYLTRDMETAFPPMLVSKFAEAMRRHRLKREIVSTQIANDLVNHMGITFVERLKESTGMSAANVAGAYVIVRDIFHLPHWFRQIEALDYQVAAEVQLALMDELMRLGRRATRWFLRSRRNELDAARDVAHFGPHLAALGLKLDELLEGPTREGWQTRYQAYVEAGVPELLARMVAGTTHLYTLLPIIEASDVTGQNAADVAKTYFAVGSALDLTWYLQQISNLPVENNWQALAREAFRDDIDWQQRAITISVLQMTDAGESIEARLALWLEQNHTMVERWRAMLVDLRAATGNDYAMYAVANRELLDLALSGQSGL